MTQEEEIRQAAKEAYIQHISNGGFGSKYDFVNGYIACANKYNQWHKAEDERIRKELIRAFKSFDSIKVWNGIERTNILSWLEKQGEQKPVEWHIEDEQNLNSCLSYIPDEFLKRWLKDIIHIKYDKDN